MCKLRLGLSILPESEWCRQVLIFVLLFARFFLPRLLSATALAANTWYFSLRFILSSVSVEWNGRSQAWAQWAPSIMLIKYLNCSHIRVLSPIPIYFYKKLLTNTLALRYSREKGSMSAKCACHLQDFLQLKNATLYFYTNMA